MRIHIILLQLDNKLLSFDTLTLGKVRIIDSIICILNIMPFMY